MTTHTDQNGYPGPPVDPVETLVALRNLPDIRGAIVTEHVSADGRTVLVGYLTGPDAALGTTRIRQRLTSQLPDYLIPQYLVVLDELPLTPDGDYDLSALAAPHAENGTADGYAAPRTPLERQLAEIMKDLLQVTRVGIHDSFFALGGSSIQASRLADRIRETFDIEVSLPDVLASPTVDELAQLIVQSKAGSAEDLVLEKH